MSYLRSDADITPDVLNRRSEGLLPGHLDIVITAMGRAGGTASFDIGRHHMAPNGFLHAGSLVTLADTLCGIACMSSLPDTASGFTTVELKSNFLGTAKTGTVTAEATPLHIGGTTQVWDCIVRHADTDKRLALFRCTQLVLRPR
ncbi:MAG: PaaI family thioesterase [Pseudomonadota bacterium]